MQEKSQKVVIFLKQFASILLSIHVNSKGILVVDVAMRHLSWIGYLSFVQASLTSDIYPIHCGCKCILLPIVIK